MHFLSGLPRSGSTVLAALLNQRNDIHVTPTSGLIDIFGAVVQTDGTLWAWGSNSAGEVGQGDVAGRSSPVQVGALTNWGYPVASGRPTAFCTRLS